MTEPRILKVACTKCGKVEGMDERHPMFAVLEEKLKERGEQEQTIPEPFGICFACVGCN